MTVCVVTEKFGRIVGTIACGVVNPEEGHIRGMAILPTVQGTGVAARFLTSAEAHFRQRNCRRISLDTTAPLARAIRLYEGSGFCPSWKVQDFLYTSTSKPFDLGRRRNYRGSRAPYFLT